MDDTPTLAHLREVAAARQVLDRLERDALVAAYDAGDSPSEIGRIIGRSREHVRRVHNEVHPLGDPSCTHDATSRSATSRS